MASEDFENSLSHIYEPLEGPEHMRLMTLEPALDTNAPLRISFSQAHYSGFSGQYEAISYTWGEQKLTLPLHIVNGALVLVTENLDRALRQLRLLHVKRLLWADAACINQKDDEEKACQIPFMIQIFRGARRVLAWLGAGVLDSDQEKGMRFLEKLSRYPRELAKADLLESEDGCNALYVGCFLNLPWFSRLWIIQEVVFNVDVILVLGLSELSWVRLQVALRILPRTRAWNTPNLDKHRIEAVTKIGALWRSHCMIDGAPTHTIDLVNEDILALMQRFSQYGCTDPRDRIFALCSMTSDIQAITTAVPSLLPVEEKISLNVDYSLSVLQLYHALATACMARGQVIPILEATLSRLTSPSDKNWPSWVPDWTKTPVQAAQGFLHAVNFIKQRPGNKIVLCSRWPWWDFVSDELPVINARFPDSRSNTKVHPLATLVQILETVWASGDKDSLQDISELLFSLELVAPRVDHTFLLEYISSLWGYTNMESLGPPAPLLQELTERLNASLAQNCFFSATRPGSGVSYIGFGSTALEVGDRFVTCEKWWSGDSSPLGPSTAAGLLLRPTARSEEVDGEHLKSYRLVGSAEISEPFLNGERFGYFYDYGDRTQNSRMTFCLE